LFSFPLSVTVPEMAVTLLWQRGRMQIGSIGGCAGRFERSAQEEFVSLNCWHVGSVMSGSEKQVCGGTWLLNLAHPIPVIGPVAG
jgi:hypothetical protein